MSNYSTISLVKNFEVPSYLENGKMIYRKFNIFPYAFYQSGLPCIPVNMYFYSSEIIKLKELTIKRVAFCLSQLIQYCEKNKIDIMNFNYDNFISFSKELKDGINVSGNKRSNTTINNILKNVLFFYDFIGKTYFDNSEYVKIVFKAELNTFKLSVYDNEKVTYSHPAFLPNTPVKTRSPITLEKIDKIYENISKVYKSSFSQERLKVLVLLLEVTGARIGEINNIKVCDIEKAYEEDKPLLKLKTLKRKSSEHRYVPIDKDNLKKVINFIKIQRKIRVKKTIGYENDSGYLFISYKDGKPLNVTSLVNEFGRLRISAGISDKMSAHMFRHRFITNMFIQLIKRYDFENKDSFRNALLDVNALKVYIQQLTGHKSLNSLDTYLHLAKSELTNMSEILEKIN